jgi:hypothetical protein
VNAPTDRPKRPYTKPTLTLREEPTLTDAEWKARVEDLLERLTMPSAECLAECHQLILAPSSKTLSPIGVTLESWMALRDLYDNAVSIRTRVAMLRRMLNP